ncbi:uncharacterized protein LOC120195264 [Hibiscus syriacus]|uniref:uncharacterized protein LOC120195264 n=1 Tax=Hibiscus syriacus TaxID=106335 RepID=UPI001923571D|nr:uncharacterized protein LOC120195264 [Hibiscus syriacus]
MATHFDSLAEKLKQSDDGDINVGTERRKHGEERAREPNYAIGKFEVRGGPGQQIRGASMKSQGFKHEKIDGNRQERGASMESKAKREQSAGASMESMGKC